MRLSRPLSRNSRVGIGRSLLIGVAVIVVGGIGLSMLFFPGQPSPSHTTTSSISSQSVSISRTSTATSYTGGHGPGLAIGTMFGNVQGPGSSYLSSNGTTVAGDTIYIGNASETLAVQFDIVYANCPANSCPTHVTSLSILDPGFTILGTKPALPIPTNTPVGASTGQVEFHFVVNVRAPSSQYNGPLLLVATTQ